MMKMNGTGLSYLEGEGFQAVSLPYLSPDFSMLVLVPDEDNLLLLNPRWMPTVS